MLRGHGHNLANLKIDMVLNSELQRTGTLATALITLSEKKISTQYTLNNSSETGGAHVVTERFVLIKTFCFFFLHGKNVKKVTKSRMYITAYL